MKCLYKNVFVLFSLMLFMAFTIEVSAQAPAPPEPGTTGSGEQIGGTGQIPSPPAPGSGTSLQQIGGSGQIPAPPSPGGIGSQQIGGSGDIPSPPEPGGGTQIGGNDTVPEPPNPGGGSGYPIGTAFQTLIVPAGWSGVSSQVIPYVASLDSIFAADLQDENLVILQNFSRIFWPAFNINTIDEWNAKDGYTIKVVEETEVDIIGLIDENDTISFVEGWNYLPVISACNVLSEALFSELVANNQLVIVHEIAGSGLYWPEQGINTLPVLERGKAYMVKVTAESEVNFPDCDPSETLSFPSSDLPDMPWQLIAGTPIQNFLVIPDAFDNIIREGDILGAFTTEGICAGAVEITGSGNQAIVIFGDDPTTPVKDGFTNGEPMKLAVYRPSSSEVFKLAFDVDGAGTATFGIREMWEMQNMEIDITD